MQIISSLIILFLLIKLCGSFSRTIANNDGDSFGEYLEMDYFSDQEIDGDIF